MRNETRIENALCLTRRIQVILAYYKTQRLSVCPLHIIKTFYKKIEPPSKKSTKKKKIIKVFKSSETI